MDISNPNNWSRIWSASLRAAMTAQHGEGVGALQVFDPIPVQTASLATPVGLVRAYAPASSIKPNWFTACWVSAYLSVVPGNKDRVYSRKIGLNQGTYLHLPNLGKFPYAIEFKIPEWLTELNLELWQFVDQSGKYLPANEQVILSAVEVVEMRQAELEREIERLTQPTQS